MELTVEERFTSPYLDPDPFAGSETAAGAANIVSTYMVTLAVDVVVLAEHEVDVGEESPAALAPALGAGGLQLLPVAALSSTP